MGGHMKTAFISAFPPEKFYTAGDWSSKLEYLSENTGNWVYINSLRKQINYDIEAWLGDPALTGGDYQAGVMPVSNILRSGYEEMMI